MKLIKANPNTKPIKWAELPPLEKFKTTMHNFGFIIPKDAEFYKNVDGVVGMKVGGYTHNCHVESSDVVILFHIDENNNHRLEEYWGCWDLVKI